MVFETRQVHLTRLVFKNSSIKLSQSHIGHKHVEYLVSLANNIGNAFGQKSFGKVASVKYRRQEEGNYVMQMFPQRFLITHALTSDFIVIEVILISS